MKKNWLAIFALIFFNLVFVLGVALSIYAIVASMWIIVGSFIISPIILFVANTLHIQDFSMFQSIASAILCLLGIAIIPVCQKINRLVIVISVNYIEYNKRIIYGASINE